jgi:hypothetical protein
MFIVPMDRGYVLLSAFQALRHLALETEEKHYNGWKPIR